MDYNIPIYDQNNNLLLDIVMDDSSYRSKELMSDNKLFLNFSLDYPIDLPLYCWCEVLGEKYFLMIEENFTKHNTENHEYRLEMDTFQAYLKTQKFERFILNPDGSISQDSDREIEFSLIMTPEDYVRLLVANMNLKDAEGGWTVGETLVSDEVLLDFNDMYCWDALNQIAEGFKTEWEIEGKIIHLRKVEKLRESAIPLSYGKGQGLLPGIQRTNEKNHLGALRVKTSERNIDREHYKSKTLKMPKGYYEEYEGIMYLTDNSGSVVQRQTPLYNTPIVPEETLDLTKIYPSRVGQVTEVIAVDPENNLYDIIDSTIPEDLNYRDCRIPGEQAIIIFQTGQIAGVEIAIEQTEDDLTGYNHAERRFQLVPNSSNGITYPSGYLTPQVGDKYAVFNISLPSKYVSEAEQKVMKEAIRHLYENEHPRFTYRATLDGIYSRNHWGEIGGFLNVGYFVRFSDPQYLAEPVDIRIIGVKTYINRPFSPEITLSNSVKGKSFMTKINELPNTEQEINRKVGNAFQYTKRTFSQAKELFNSWQHDMLGFEESIRPIAIQTMQILVGDETLQFRFVNSMTNPIEVDHQFLFNQASKVFHTDSGIIQHMTLGIDSLSAERKPEDYKYWTMNAFVSAPLVSEGHLWLYARCPRSGGNGTFLFLSDMVEYDHDPSYYYFLTGSLSSEDNGQRSFVTLYGFTEILPGQIRVNKIINPDGDQYWDMLGNRVNFGNSNSGWSWNVDEPNRFVIRGGITQSPGGDIDYIEVDRGIWNNYTVYYPGDKVSYNGNIYKCIRNSSPGILPTNEYYWKLLVTKGGDGEKGDQGDSVLFAYYPSNSITPPSRPQTPGTIPFNWYDAPTLNGMRYCYVSQCKMTNGSWGMWSNPTHFIIEPEPGNPGPAVVFRGEWANVQRSRMYNNSVRRDVVVANWGWGNTYYIYKGTDGSFPSVPFNDNEWESFGAQFSSVATDLLLAVNANVGGWIFRNERLESQSGGAFLDGRSGTVDITGTFTSNADGNKIQVNPSTRSIQMINSSGKVVMNMSFENTSGYQSVPKIEMFMYNTSGTLVYKYVLDSSGYRIYDGYGDEITGIGPNYIFAKTLPSGNVGLKPGRFWRDGNTVKIVT